MRPFRTLREALSDAARSGEGYTFVAGSHDVRRSYGEIERMSLRVARSLREAGLRRHDLAALAIGDAEQFLTTLFGASLAGVVPASLDPPPTGGDLSRYLDRTMAILRTARAAAVITTAACVEGFEARRSSCPDLALVLAYEELDAPALEPAESPSLDDVAFVQFTSGSTSAPKGVVVSHRNLSANVDAINGPAGLGTTSEDSAVSWLPLSHDMGLVGMALGPLYAARPAAFLTPQAFVRRPVEWLRAIARFRATVSFAPNFAYDLAVRRVKDRDLEGLDLSCWRVAGCGAEPIYPPTLAAFAQRFKPAGFRETSFLPCYGLAEHVLAAAFPPRGRTPRVEHVARDDVAERRRATVADGPASIPLVSCGRPLPGHDIRIVGEDGALRPDRAIGEIALTGASVMLGYYQDEATTARIIRDGWLYTGDLGFLSEGELFVCGRIKDIIIVNGRKYHPQDLEHAVADVPGIRLGGAVAFGVSRDGTADRLVFLVEPSGTVAPATLDESIRRRIADVFGLHVAEVVPDGAIARTTTGKVRRAVTKANYEGRG